MRLELLKDVWVKMGVEFEKRLEEAQTDEERAVYQYMVENVIPEEIDFIETDAEYDGDTEVGGDF